MCIRDRPESLQEDGKRSEQNRTVDLLANENISRFDKARKKKKGGKGQRQNVADTDRQQPKQGGGKPQQDGGERRQRQGRNNGKRPNPNRPQKNNQQQDAKE